MAHLVRIILFIRNSLRKQVMVDFQYPEGADQFEAAAFNQDGTWIKSGHREECELAAIQANGLFCLWINGGIYIKNDFEIDGRDE